MPQDYDLTITGRELRTDQRSQRYQTKKVFRINRLDVQNDKGGSGKKSGKADPPGQWGKGLKKEEHYHRSDLRKSRMGKRGED